FLTWFTYESAGTSVSNNANVGDARHRWFTAQGSYDESGVDLTVILTRGGRLDRGNTVTREEVGTMRLEFLACNSGVLTYDIETDESGRLTGTIPIQRVVTDNQLLCEQFLSNEAAEAGQALLAVSRPEVVTGEPVSVVWRAPRGMQCRPEGTTANWANATLMGTHGSLPVTMEQAGEHVLTMKCKDGQGRSMRKQTVVKAKTSNDRAQSSGPEIIVNEGLNDAWADPETDGQGVLINVLPEVNAVFAAWFTYDNFDASGGNADVGSADHRWMTAFGPIDGDRSEMQMFVNRGGAFDQGQPPSVSEPYGTLDLSFDSCDEITAKYNLPAAGEAGTMNLRRIVQDRVASCLTKGSNGEDEGRLVRPENKERLPNACNGQLDWVFDWEAFPNATSYEIEISHERDEQPRIREQTANNTYRVRKSSDIPQDQLDGWTWRVRWLRVDTFTILEGPWSEYEFSVEPLSACD
ncbi:MAG: hypothetical protein V2I48_07325, partial [Xanthomonadales bacterium]|nr:hypothetical protein [Xanthomonadales bacterium]